MGWFNQKQNTEKVVKDIPPRLPELPKLPDLPNLDSKISDKEPLHQLPTFPNNSLGEKFSQDTIKEAVTGKKEGEGVFDANEFEENEMQTMPEPPKQSQDELSLPEPKIQTRFKTSTREAEPIFIRIDKFEESLQIFEKVKERISEINILLKETKELKEKEEQELDSWEKQMQGVKQQIEKVDKELFSKL